MSRNKKFINKLGQRESFLLEDESSQDEFDDECTFTIEKEVVDLPEDYFVNSKGSVGVGFKDVITLEMSGPLVGSRKSGSHIGNTGTFNFKKFHMIGNTSMSSIKNTLSSNSIRNFLSDSTNLNINNNGSLRKLNSLITLGKVFSQMNNRQRRTENIQNLNQNFNTNSINNNKQIVIQKIIYKRKRPFEFFICKERNYCIIKCMNITTYFVDNYIFSMFTHPEARELDRNIDCTYLIADKETHSFKIDQKDPDELIELLNLDANFNKSKIDRRLFKKFIDGINDYLNFSSLFDEYRKKKIMYLVVSFILCVIIIGLVVLSVYLNFFSTNEKEVLPDVDPDLPFPDEEQEEEINNAWASLIGFATILAILLILFVRFLVYGLITLDQIKEYEILLFHIENFTNVEMYFEKWNVELFIPNAIYVSCPVNLEYIQFNLDPFKEIELEHHEFGGGL